MSAPAQDKDAEGVAHTPLEDLQALISAALLMALAVTLFSRAGLQMGGAAGLAFLAHYAAGMPFGRAYFLVNLPFYFFAVRRMGWSFTRKTLGAVSLLSLFAELAPRVLTIGEVQPAVAAVLGGLLAGLAMMILYRHGASFGGVTILAAFLQDHLGLRAGYVQMAIDVAVLALTLFVKPPLLVVTSLLGAAAVNLTLVVNHKPGRYAGL